MEFPAASAGRTCGRFPYPGIRGFSFFPMPFGVQQSHRLGARLQRVALVELERPPAVLALLALLAGESLDRRRRQAAQHLGEVRAAAHAAEKFARFAAEILD